MIIAQSKLILNVTGYKIYTKNITELGFHPVNVSLLDPKTGKTMETCRVIQLLVIRARFALMDKD